MFSQLGGEGLVLCLCGISGHPARVGSPCGDTYERRRGGTYGRGSVNFLLLLPLPWHFRASELFAKVPQLCVHFVICGFRILDECNMAPNTP